MKSGYKIFWTDQALFELKRTIKYLEENWSEREIKNFFQEVEHTIELISKNPDLFPSSGKSDKIVRRAIIAKRTKLYYWVNDKTIEILSLFSNRQNPDKNKY